MAKKKLKKYDVCIGLHARYIRIVEAKDEWEAREMVEDMILSTPKEELNKEVDFELDGSDVRLAEE